MKKSLASTLHEVDPGLTIIGRRGRHRYTTEELEAMRYPSVEERIRGTPAPRRMVRELDEQGNPGPPLVCPVCHREVEELYPYGYMGQRWSCPECIKRRHTVLEARGRVIRAKSARGGATRMRMMMIKSAAKKA